MVNKVVLFAVVSTMFLLCSCVDADVLYEGTENPATASMNNEEFDSGEIDETVNEATDGITTTTPAAISVPEPYFLQDEQPAVDPLCPRNRCVPGCEMLYIDGEYIPRCDIYHKYTFIFYSDFNRWDEWDGKIVGNWWGEEEDTRPSRGVSSDNALRLFIIQNDRIMLDDVPHGFPQELTTTQWDDFGVQIFQFAGDATLIGMQGTLSQMPELQEDDFAQSVFFCEEQTAGREVLYIFHHELQESKLWNLIMN